jgi:hypothetical protein
MEATNEIRQDLQKLKRDVELIKNILSSEGDLTPWAKKQLAKARTQPEETYTDLAEF